MGPSLEETGQAVMPLGTGHPANKTSGPAWLSSGKDWQLCQQGTCAQKADDMSNCHKESQQWWQWVMEPESQLWAN